MCGAQHCVKRLTEIVQSGNAASSRESFSVTVASNAVVPTGVIPIDDTGAERLKRIAKRLTSGRTNTVLLLAGLQ